MTPEHQPEQETTPTVEVEAYEPPAIIALGKLDEVTFGAAGPPFEGATSYF
jgi:hypothetical protein